MKNQLMTPDTPAPAASPRGRTAVLLLTCPDRPGIVAAVSEFLFRHGANLLSVDQHSDPDDKQFFQRIEFEREAMSIPRGEIAAAFAPLARQMDATFEVRFPDTVQRVAILVSKQVHCLLDLLARATTGDLPAQIAFVASNHPLHQATCDYFGVPFHHLPIVDGNKESQEKQLAELLKSEQVDLVVLARYMQILSTQLIEQMPYRIINIHHSLLPAFVGAKPYHQAYGRGVKIVGATAHYATADLDEGPIIAQDVARVTHRDSVEDLVRRGKDLEALTLASAVRLHLAAKVLVHQNRTVTFP